ncbi:hypothetical protein PMAYCL1PPCAC_09828, partial [Pristionchus mayeri]
MRVAVVLSLLIPLITAQAHIQDSLEKCNPPRVIFCGHQRHELNKFDCERWDHLYCTKTLGRRPPKDGCITTTALAWDRSQDWRILISATAILTLPCLAMDEFSLTLICRSEKCNDTLVDEGIRECSAKYSRGLVQYVERPNG